jgi:hypothetical protein
MVQAKATIIHYKVERIEVQLCKFVFTLISTGVPYGKPLPPTVIEEKWISQLCIGQFM